MNRRKLNNSIRLPMIEMIIVYVIFMIASVIVVRMFISTYRVKTKATDISQSLMEAESIAERFKGSNETLDIEKELGAVKIDTLDSAYALYYDSNWKQTKEQEDNIIVISPTQKATKYGVMDVYEIKAYDKKSIAGITEETETLCHLQVKRYREGMK